MEKLLHERLRDGAAKTDLTFIFEIGDEKVDFRSKHALAIADEIERYYIPRPRFEDGEPVPWGCKDIIWNDGEKYWVFNAIDDKGVPVAIGTSEVASRAEMTDDGFTKRPTPKVYDADGVEIKVGDKGWLNYREHEMLEIKAIHPTGSTPWYACDYVEYSDFTLGKAKYFTHEKPVFDADGERIKVGDTVYDIKDGNESVVKRTDSCNSDGKPIICMDGCPGELWYKPEQLTHTEPVFDADNVRICKGDTVWCLSNGGEKGRVDDFVSCDTVSVIWEVDGSRTNGVAAKNLTHKEPDSLEKLRDTLIDLCGFDGEDSSPLCDEIADCADRLTALIERGA